uniref:Uncharacterized protein n=1 Tax=viral metagenome TaxID=1070528 RepID=A0A6H2A1B7_9ZZZZ
MTEDVLKDFTKSDYLSFKDQNPIEGIYKGVRVEDDPFHKGDQRLNYTIEVDGKNRPLTSKSKRLAGAVIKAKVKEGDHIRIERIGLGFDTDFNVEKVESKEDIKKLKKEV